MLHPNERSLEYSRTFAAREGGQERRFKMASDAEIESNYSELTNASDERLSYTFICSPTWPSLFSMPISEQLGSQLGS